jgi:hypothetical protein
MLQIDGKVTDLYIYLNRPKCIRTGPTEPLSPEHKGKTMNELTYLEFYTIYTGGQIDDWNAKVQQMNPIYSDHEIR